MIKTKNKALTIIKTKNKAPRVGVQTKLPFWTDKFDKTFVFPKVKTTNSASSFNSKKTTSTSNISSVSSCSPTPSKISPVAISTCTPTSSSISSLARFQYTGQSSTVPSHTSTTTPVEISMFPTTSAPIVSKLTQNSSTPVAQNPPTVSNIMQLTQSSVSKSSISFSGITLKPGQFDICNCRTKVKALSNNEIKDLIDKIFPPDTKFVFPKKNGRRFQYSWLNMHPWLCYSPSSDGAFCLPCVLFGDKFPAKVSKIRKLFSEPFTHWPDGTQAFNRHESSTSGIHTECMRMYNTVLSNSLPIDVLIDNNRKNIITQNRQKLVPIVDAIIVCGRQGLALRGHRDDAKYQPDLGGYSTEQTGNFVELLNFRIRGGDKVLEEHLSKCPKNATYVSKTTQNELIECCGKVILDKILSEIKSNQYFSIMADELLDNSNKEQLSLVIRYVDQNFNIREDFIAFLHCESGLTGLDLSQLVLEALENLGLSYKDCRGQGYDGAGNVAGHLSGLSARILAINHKAIYVHCSSHRLNLCVAKSCSVTLVRNVMNKIKSLSYFFNFSQNRQQLLQKHINELYPEASKTKLKDVCRTRWVERIDGMEVFEELFVPLFVTLDAMSVSINKICNRDTSSQALSFFNDLSNFEFIVSLVITRKVLSLTHGVTILLQDRSIDIMDNISHITNLKNTLINCRNQIDLYHGIWYKEALDLAEKVEVEEKMKRVVKR